MKWLKEKLDPLKDEVLEEVQQQQKAMSKELKTIINHKHDESQA